DHGGELHVGVFEYTLEPQGVPIDLAHKLLAGPSQVTEVLDRCRRNEASADQTMSEQISDPCGIFHIALTAPGVSNVHGVGQHQVELAFEHVPPWLQEPAGRLHGYMRAPAGEQPIRKGEQIPRTRPEGVHFLSDLAFGHQPHAGHHRLLVHVEPRAPFVDNVHCRALLPLAASAWSPRCRNLESALRGHRPLVAVRGARRAQGPTVVRADRTTLRPTSALMPRRASTTFHASWVQFPR